MNRYVRSTICLITTNIKFAYLKLINGKKFTASAISVCSPMTEFDVRGGQLHIGKKLKTRSNCHIRVRKNATISIGDNVSLNYGDMVICHENITIGDNVQFGPNVLIYDHDHDFRHPDGLKANHFKTTPVIIGDNCWIGANSVILRGTTLGNNCVVGAGSVIKGSFSDGTVIVQKREMSLKNVESKK